jgi:NAD(P)-dependent dehydrogenase (short-subunit alcohol dehydrogenase family)
MAGKPLDASVVVVTGAAGGIGSAIVDDLSRRGARVVAADIRWLGAGEAEPAERPDLLRCGVDIADADSAEMLAAQTIERFGTVDAVVNNAGIDAPPGLAWEIDRTHWNKVIAVDLTGAWWVTQAFLPYMRAQRSGRIVMMSSLAARIGSNRYSPAYAAAKAGLLGLTVGLAAQLDADGILCNAITPGATGTTGTPMESQEREQLLHDYPLGIGGVQPIVDAVRYLLEPSGDWLSGAVLNVSGGQFRGI